MPPAVSILFGAVWTVATAWALGRLLFSVLRPRLGEARDLLAFVTGSALLSTLIFALGLLDLIYDATFWILGLACLGGGLWRIRREQTERHLPAASLWFWLLYVPFAAIYIICAAAPEMSPDGSGYHLGIIGTYYREHGINKIETHMYANLSQGVEMLFLMAYAYGRHSAAALLHCAYLLTLPLLIVTFGNRFQKARAGQIAALLTFCSPVFGVDGASAYIDVAVTCGLFAVVLLVELWRSDRQPALVPLIGLIAGFGYAMKYTAFLAVPYAFAVVMWRDRRWRTAFVFIACAAAMILPWLGRNAVWYNNPFSPLLNAWFPNPYIHVAFEKEYAEYMRHYDLKSLWEIPLEVTVRGKMLCGLLGPVFLLSPLALLALRDSIGRRMLFASLWFGAPYVLNIGTRFLMPAIPFLSIALALTLGRWAWAAAALTLAHAISAVPPVTAKYSDPYAWRILRIPLRQALRLQTADAWLNYRWPSYRIAKMVDLNTPERSVVFTFTPFAESYTSRDIWTSYQSAKGERLRDQIWAALIPDWQPQQATDFRFPSQQARRVRVVQTAGESRDQWSVHEMRVFHDAIELPRANRWRLRATPFPWDVQRAFDNHPGTRWRSWQHLTPAMSIEIDFGQPEILDAISLEASVDQHAVRLQAELDTGDGVWRRLDAKSTTRSLVPFLGLRKLAMEDLKASGASYLLVSAGDYGYDDFENNASLWGIRRVGQVDGNRLYRIE